MVDLLKETLLYGTFFVCFYSYIGLLISGIRKNGTKLTLSFYMLAASIFYALTILKYLNYHELFNYFESFYYGLMLCAFPLLYIYMRSLVVNRWYCKKLLLHFIPFLVIGTMATLFYFELNYDERIYYLRNFGDKSLLPSSEMKSVYFIFRMATYIYLVQGVVYLYGIIRLYKKYKTKIQNLYSNTATKELKRLKLIIYVLLVMVITFIVSVSIIGLNHIWEKDMLSIISSVFIIFSVGLLGILGAKQKNIYNADSELGSQRYISQKDLKTKLLEQFNNNKIFLKKDLSIWDVCSETLSNRTYVSHVINKEFGEHFNGFVNRYRVEEAKGMLADKEFSSSSLKNIAERSGFNSLASFNRVFKKFESVSPGKYREDIQN